VHGRPELAIEHDEEEDADDDIPDDPELPVPELEALPRELVELVLATELSLDAPLEGVELVELATLVLLEALFDDEAALDECVVASPAPASPAMVNVGDAQCTTAAPATNASADPVTSLSLMAILSFPRLASRRSPAIERVNPPTPLPQKRPLRLPR
jgi:hypothetical protein